MLLYTTAQLMTESRRAEREKLPPVIMSTNSMRIPASGPSPRLLAVSVVKTY